MDKSTAQSFADYHGTDVEDWMLWEGWDEYIGCDLCDSDGPEAPCWGMAQCHGYMNGCGCRECTQREQEEDD